MGTTSLMLMVMAFVFMSLMIMIVILTFMLMVVSLSFMIMLIVSGLRRISRTTGKQVSAHRTYQIYFLHCVKNLDIVNNK